MERSRRDLLNNMAEYRPILKIPHVPQLFSPHLKVSKDPRTPKQVFRIMRLKTKKC